MNKFMKSAAVLLLGCMVLFLSGCNNRPGDVSLVVDPNDAIASAQPAQWALGQLKEALEAQDVRATIYAQLDDAPDNQPCVVVSGSTNKLAHALLDKQSLTVPETPEALGLVEGELGGRQLLLACGHGARGLVYALLELADRINHGAPLREALHVPEPIIEKPAVRIRSIYRAFCSEIEDKGWYNDREFWTHYLSELATQRVNRFSLTLGMGYNKPIGLKDSYLFFAYPFLLDVPGYDVHAVGLPDAERDRNFEMLKFISKETATRGMEFQLQLWSHGKDWRNSDGVNYPIHGLTDENHAPYCRDALEMILKACPDITGITLRVHNESGVPHGSEKSFWKIFFQAFPKAGRPIWIDMHGKQITQGQISDALATGMPVSVSPKYWGEHQGLAYHQADIRQMEKGSVKFVEPESGVFLDSRAFTRYGYGDLMPEDREWEILHRAWAGTQKLLICGDPALAAGYGNISSFCGSLGVEWPDPLFFKGRKGSGHPGGRCAYADKSLQPKWDFQKFLYTYRVWGRLVYNPDTDPDVWMRFLRSKFGAAAKQMEIAMAHSSRVLMLITTAHGYSPNCAMYYPELYSNMPIVVENRSFGDTDVPRVFGNVSPLDPQLFSKMNGFAAALLKGETLAKYSPLEVAQWLEDMAKTSDRNLTEAATLVEDRSDVEFRRFYHDIRIQNGIARFFAFKMRAAVLWHLYEGSGDMTALKKAIEKYTKARDYWAEMAEQAKPVYVSDISFGQRDKQRGHWADQVPAIDADIADMRQELAKAQEKGDKAGHSESISQAIRIVEAPAQRTIADCLHEPAESFKPGNPMEIKVTLQAGEADEVHLYYRHVNQAVNWQVATMKTDGEKYVAIIPGHYTQTRYPMEYYFAIDTGQKGIALYPGLDENLANMPYYVVRQKR
ncbi:hypothetical protein ACFL6U_12100 [Planctomycetota bacterium]